MLIRWKHEADACGRERVEAALFACGARFAYVESGDLVVQEGAAEWMRTLAQDAAVAEVIPLRTPYKLAARAVNQRGTVVRVGSVSIGGGELVVIAGPCSVETDAQMHETANAVARSGASMLRAGAWKPRTSPYAFRGHGPKGLAMLERAGADAGLPTVTEVMSVEDVELVARHADVLQVGARNAQNFALLEALGRVDRPVLLKRGPSMTVEELLLAAEYVLAHGNPNVILCERGIRTFERATRNTLDLGAVAALKRATHLPVLVDPSHACGRRELVVELARAAVAVGADGLLVEVHPRPDESWSDAEQAISPETFDALMRALVVEAPLHGRPVATKTGTIEGCRARIDAIDEALVRLLDQRIGLALRIGDEKRRRGEPTRVPERERVVLRRVAEVAAKAHDPEAIARAFESIVHETREAEARAASAVTGTDAAAE